MLFHLFAFSFSSAAAAMALLQGSALERVKVAAMLHFEYTLKVDTGARYSKSSIGATFVHAGADPCAVVVKIVVFFVVNDNRLIETLWPWA